MSIARQIPSADQLIFSLFVAVTVHAVLVLGISFDLPQPRERSQPDRTLEIIVVQKPAPAKPTEKADYLAQSSQAGGGEEEKKSRPKSAPAVPEEPPVPMPVELEPAPLPAAPPVERQQPPPPLTQKKPAPKKVVTRPQPPPTVEKAPITAARLLASTNREISRLSAEIDRKTVVQAQKPRHKRITASTQEFKYANYMEAWKRKVERIGNLNYPDEAKRRKLFGSLILHVALLPDGSIHSINIRKSSGHQLLDDAAVRIVKLASPFAPFPADIRAETDILDITRTWQFLNNNQLFAK